jgi:hypothetical protein
VIKSERKYILSKLYGTGKGNENMGVKGSKGI